MAGDIEHDRSLSVRGREALRRLALLAVALALAIAAGASGPRADRAAAEPGVGADFFGVYSEDALDTQQLERHVTFGAQSQAGVGLVRAPFDWQQIETGQNWWYYGRLDGFMLAAAASGVSVLPTLINAPPWASSAPRRGGVLRRGIYPPAHPAEFAAFARRMVERYGPGGAFWLEHPDIPYRPVRAWQVWNEPNIPYFWPSGPDPAAYTALLVATADAIHAADPGAQVVTAGITSSVMGIALSPFLDGMYRAGAKGHYDLLGVHPYAKEVDDSLALLRTARAVMDAHGDNSPMWATEFGWASDGEPSPYTSDEHGQAIRVESALRRMAAARAELRLRGIVYYDWRDSISSVPGPGLWPAHAGLLRLDGSPKPAYYAFRRAALDLADPSSAAVPVGAPSLADSSSTPSGPPAGGGSPQAGLHVPALRLSAARTLTPDGDGSIFLRAECVASSGQRCAGGIRLERGARGGRVLARRSYVVPAGTHTALRLRLTSSARRLLRKARTLRVSAAFLGTPAERPLKLTLRRR